MLNNKNNLEAEFYSLTISVERKHQVKSFGVDKPVSKFYTSFVYHLGYSMEKNMKDGVKYEKLCYSGQRCQKIPEALIKMYGTKTQSLDLSYNELITLRGLEGFPLLKELILDNNELSDTLVLPYLPHLNLLSLNKNKIFDIETLITKIQHNLPSLNYLSLLGNKACPNELADAENDEEDYQRYRYFVLYHLPNLKFLDSTKVREFERAEAKRRGKFMRVIRPVATPEDDETDTQWDNRFTPLPKNLRSLDDQRGSIRKCKKVYQGKHSEGNRFISNNDL
ncbi:leucine-rich melanocyte differentiation-associated protein-like isoform X1 [Coccinella septempunctata]|uniref:leucine-rich melanocyte differentiation-associated protein-like isoform X1 n=1 Tax=Coccinella septempunctata TaxID=41139 RepID=UPI001D092833|nr:leucine-rich melanocyte differentiation-associated protein-like isoform X1 [Coccinella septempunctata]